MATKELTLLVELQKRALTIEEQELRPAFSVEVELEVEVQTELVV